METVRGRLVREAAAKRNILWVHELEGWAGWYDDEIFHSDEDHDSIRGGESYALRTCGPQLAVRVHVAHGTTPDVAVRMLRKMAGWVQRTPAIVGERPPEP